MSPSVSDRNPGRRGFTLIEVIVGMTVASLLGIAVVRFYKDTYRTYSIQEEIAERNLNAHFVVNKFVDVLQQAGSGLPDTGWTSMRKSGTTLIVGVNPRGGEHFVTQAASLNNFIAVSDAKKFKNTDNVLMNTTHVLIDYALPGRPTRTYRINTSYNDTGFVKGIKDNASGTDSIRIDSAVTLQIGDRIYGYREDHYLLDRANLIVRPNGDVASEMVLAENIDSLGFTFLTATGASTPDWKAMRSAAITVRARTTRPDPRLPAPGYRMIVLPMNVILRNRI